MSRINGKVKERPFDAGLSESEPPRWRAVVERLPDSARTRWPGARRVLLYPPGSQRWVYGVADPLSMEASLHAVKKWLQDRLGLDYGGWDKMPLEVEGA